MECISQLPVTKILKWQTFEANKEIDFKREKYVVLVEYLEEQTDYRRYKRRNRKSRRGPSWRWNQPYLFTFPYRTNGNHATELSTVSHVISERRWKITLDFTEIVNKYGLKRGTVCQIVKFISHYSLKLCNNIENIVAGSSLEV